MAGSIGVVLMSRSPIAGGADQNQLAADPVGGHVVLQNVLGRYVTVWVVRRKMNPELSIAVGRHFETGDGDATDAGGVALDPDRTGVGDDAQHFQRQCRSDRALRLHHHGRSAHHAVGLGADGEHTAAGGGPFENRNVPEYARKVHEIGAWIRSHHGESNARRLRTGLRQG
jgi:hypothetical protein